MTNKHEGSVEGEQVNILANGILIFNQEHKNRERIPLDIVRAELCPCQLVPTSVCCCVGGEEESGPDFIDPGESNIQDGATSGALTDTNAGLTARPRGRRDRRATAARGLLPLKRKARCAGRRCVRLSGELLVRIHVCIWCQSV